MFQIRGCACVTRGAPPAFVRLLMHSVWRFLLLSLVAASTNVLVLLPGGHLGQLGASITSAFEQPRAEMKMPDGVIMKMPAASTSH